MKFLFTIFATLVFCFCSNAQIIVNGYAKVTGIAGNVLSVSNVNETNDTYEDGEYVIVMQMQDDVIGANTADAATFGDLSAILAAGQYEVAQILSHTEVASLPNTITLTGALVGTYNTGANSSLQIITYPNLGPNYTPASSITGYAWDGNIGGVISFSVGGVLTLNNSITADGIGFRGGSRSADYYDGTTNCISTPYRINSTNQAFKGESIYKITNATYNNARAKVLNGGGGGNHINGGGGGGGNFTNGGDGGYGWDGSATGCPLASSVGGLGGLSLAAQIGVNRVFMGGGGGGGQQNNTVGTSGTNGGGIILIRAGTLTTTGACSVRISANGLTATNSGNDGSGGGGAGGAIVLQIPVYSVTAGCPLNINANGGGGGNVISSTHSGGGGGGQGSIFFSIIQPTNNITTTTSNGPGGCNQSPCSSNAGSGSGSNNSGIFINLTGVLPVELISFEAQNMEKKVALSWTTLTEKNSNYFFVERSSDAKSWNTISRVKAAENSQHMLYYECFDETPLKGISYYRLKMEDLDKTFEYSQLKVVERNEKEIFVILYPNPTSGFLNVASSYKINEVTFEVFDISGKKVEVSSEIVSEDKMVLNLSELSKGVYFVSIKTPDGNVVNSNKIILK